MPRSVTRTKRSSWGLKGSAFLKSFQKSPMAFLHSSSAALTVKLRFTCPTRRAVAAPARAQTTRTSSVLKPRCSVWKWTSITPASARIGGMLRTSS
ncbi:hypothetical protein D3C71_1536780 [compost metagenome]